MLVTSETDGERSALVHYSLGLREALALLESPAPYQTDGRTGLWLTEAGD